MPTETGRARKAYHFPNPIRPREDALFLVFMLAMIVLTETQSPLAWAVAIAFCAFTYIGWRTDRRKFRMAQLEWALANAQNWVRHYEKTQDAEATRNWQTKIQRLENKLEFLRTHRWKLDAPDSAEEILEKTKEEAIERAQKRRVKAFKVGDRIRFKEQAVDGRQVGTITSVAKDGSLFHVKWDLYKEPVLMSYSDVEELELIR